MRSGFIGLGDQGGPMAEMMLQAGLPLSVWARRTEAAEAFQVKGAAVSDSPMELAGAVEFLSVCVTADVDVREIVFDKGVLDAMKPASILAVHSTITPALCVEIAAAAQERRIFFLDAPVSGSGRAALAKTLLVMIGGDVQALERARPVIETYANPIIHVGAPGDAMKMKLLNNLLGAAHQGAAIQALRGAAASGVSPDVARTVMLAGVARSFGLEVVARLQVADRAKHIRKLVVKDLALARNALTAPEFAPLFSLADVTLAALDTWSRGEGQILSET